MEDILMYVVGGIKDIFIESGYIWMIVGSMLGIIVGAIPGFTSSMATGILLPVTFALSPINSLIFLVSVYISTIYGGSITAILLNTPGAPESSATTFDGYQMTLQGKGFEALGVSIMSSFIGGMFSYILMIFAMIPIAWFAIKMGSTELFLIAILGVSILATLSKENASKTLLSGFFGLLVGTIGILPTGEWRGTFGMIYLSDGVQVIPAIIGFFALSEIFTMIEKDFIVDTNINQKRDIRMILKGFVVPFRYPITLIKSSIIGVVVGAIPAAGATIAAFASYGEAKRSSKNGSKFGTGFPEGIVAPETANNACTGGALMTTLALGIPGSSTTAILLSALMLQGLRPGPQLVRDQMPLVYAIIMACIISQLIMVILAVLSGYGLTNLLRIPTKILAPVIAVFCIFGTFSVRNAVFDVWVMVIFGLIGLLMKKFDFSLPAIVLGIVLGKIADNELIRSYMRFGDEFYLQFIKRPISLVLLVIIVSSIVYPFVQDFIKMKYQRK